MEKRASPPPANFMFSLMAWRGVFLGRLLAAKGAALATTEELFPRTPSGVFIAEPLFQPIARRLATFDRLRISVVREGPAEAMERDDCMVS